MPCYSKIMRDELVAFSGKGKVDSIGRIKVQLKSARIVIRSTRVGQVSITILGLQDN